jgi:hypothetical protein
MKKPTSERQAPPVSYYDAWAEPDRVRAGLAPEQKRSLPVSGGLLYRVILSAAKDLARRVPRSFAVLRMTAGEG